MACNENAATVNNVGRRRPSLRWRCLHTLHRTSARPAQIHRTLRLRCCYAAAPIVLYSPPFVYRCHLLTLLLPAGGRGACRLSCGAWPNFRSMAATASAGGKAPLPIKVLYMHGLESTAWGAKSDRLKHVVAEVEAVQMPVKHLRALSGPNPHVKAALACALVGVLAIAGGLLLLLHSDEVWEAGLNWRQQLAVVLLFAGGLSLAATLLFVQWALQFLVEACYAVQRAALRRFKPDVVMGSSFGGGMAQLLLARGEWAGPTVLLAPAGEQVASYYDLLASIMTCWVCGCGRRCRGHSEQGDCHPMLHLPPEVPPAAQLPSGGAESSAGGASPGVPVLIVHSPVDTVVPFRDSLEWVAGRPDWMQCQVLPVPQDGHDLRKVALKVNMRKWLQGVWQAWRADEELSVDSDMKLGKPRSPAPSS